MSAPRNTTDRGGLTTLALSAVGVVFGDIGTSPLYAMKEAFHGEHGFAPEETNIFGILSLVIWSLFIVVSVKYVLFIMRADNKGEGGIMALMALARGAFADNARLGRTVLALGVLGASLFYGDSMITPAISVLSAVEGLEVGTPALAPYVLPVTISVLIGLFWIQSAGTAGVAAWFSPIMCLWFVSLAALGVSGILREPSVLWAFNPAYAWSFFAHHKLVAFFALGAVFLAVTGGEALYADLGHFGRRPIRLAWFALVLPALLLNYLGQGALLLDQPEAVRNPFYLLAPQWAFYPMVALSTCATVIASQAVISGAFSITRQAIQLGYCPRLQVNHTSSTAIGQIYLPSVNWGLCIGTIGLVLGFQSSSSLAAAYGIAVTGTMAIDTLLVSAVVYHVWKWSPIAVGVGLASMLSIDLAFLGANALKIPHGGWVSLLGGGLLFTLLATWKRGREVLAARLQADKIGLESLLYGLGEAPPLRVPGTAVFLTALTEGAPHALLHNLVHNKVLHERVVFLTVRTHDVPWIDRAQRVEVHPMANNFFRIIVHYGFKDEPDIPAALALCKVHGVDIDLMETSFFLSRETMIPSRRPGMALWRERLFVQMASNAESAMEYFKIPTNRVIELGTQLEL